MDSLIELHGLHFAYGDHAVLRGIDVDIKQGELIVLLGPNGAGKTTLVELLMGSLKPQSGHLRVLGRDPRQSAEQLLTDIGLVMQHYSDHAKWTVEEFLRWVYCHYLSGKREPLMPDQALALVGLTDKVNAKMSSLSGGQRRRIDMAAALIGRPPLLILDEPTTGLDPQARQLMHRVLEQCIDEGATVLMTTHDMGQAQELADRVLVLNNGQIVASGSPQQLRDELVSPCLITWFAGGKRHVHASDHPEVFLKTLDLDEITGLEVTRPTLEDAYLALVGEGTEVSS